MALALSAANVICFSGFLDLLGVSIILPLMQPHLLELGVSATVAGLVGSLYGCLQLFSSPVVGQWSDQAGRRYALVLSLTVCGVAYIVMGAATTVILFAVSRVPLGLFKHSQMISKAYLSESVPTSSLSGIYGRFNSISVIGFIIGPAIGGHIVHKYSFHAAAVTAGAIFLINAVIVQFIVPTDTKTARVRPNNDETHPGAKPELISSNIYKMLRSLKELHWSNVWDLLLANFMLGIAFIAYRNNLHVYLSLSFGTTSVTNGYIISAGSAVSTVTGLFAGAITRQFTDDFRLLKIGTAMQLCIFAGLYFAEFTDIRGVADDAERRHRGDARRLIEHARAARGRQ